MNCSSNNYICVSALCVTCFSGELVLLLQCCWHWLQAVLDVFESDAGFIDLYWVFVGVWHVAMQYRDRE